MYIDIFLIILLVWAVVNGWRNGFVKELLNTAGVLLGLIVACALYYLLADFLSVTGTKVNMVLSVIAFLIICFLIPFGLGVIATGFTRLLRDMKVGLPNSLLGSAVSIVKYVLIISFAFNIMENLGIMNPERTEHSTLYTPVRSCLDMVRDEAKVQLHRRITAPDGERNDTTIIRFDRRSDADAPNAADTAGDSPAAASSPQQSNPR